ncbi:MAG: AMP-binding protein, partial [Candidatus Thermoplasmatota archaeon]|nr:AMP-binding protein [Candidatus Thermoplasmatota archaeon]
MFKEKGIDPSSIRTIEDLQKLPLTTKKDFLATEKNPYPYKDFILQPNEELIRSSWPKGKLIKLALSKAAGKDVAAELHKEYWPTMVIATSGTTGNNVPFVYSHYDINLFGNSFLRNALTGNLQKKDKGMNLFPFAPHLAFFHVVVANIQSDYFLYHTGGGSVTPTDKAIELAQKLEVTTLFGIPSYIYHFVRTAEESGKKLPKVNRVFGAGERFPEGSKKRIENTLLSMGSKNVEIYDVYGTTEMRTAFSECKPYSQHFHTHPDILICEIVDPKTGEQKGPNESGVLAITSIDGRGSTVLRYLVGDIMEGGMEYGKCPHCGSGVPRLIGPIGRMADYDENIQLTNVKGTLINLYGFYNILPTIPSVGEWQVVLSKKNNDPYDVDILTIYASVAGGANPETVAEEIRRKVSAEMEVTPKVKI